MTTTATATEKREQAVKVIEECRDIHQRYIDGLRQLRPAQQRVQQQGDRGDISHHERWIRNYDLVLAELERA